jgi:predicted lipoprotein with Yx(FWY)xxD motif
MKNAIKLFIFSTLVIGLSGCGTNGSINPYGTSTPTTPTSTPTSTGRNSSEIGVASGHLVDASGFALYVTGSSCTGSCLTVWPPDDASSAPTATGGANQSLIGLSSGQVTYRGRALYYFESDTASGQANGNGVGGFSLATP